MSELVEVTEARAAYIRFLEGKMPRAQEAGFAPPSEASASLFPHQRDICECAEAEIAVPTLFDMNQFGGIDVR